MGLGFQIQFLHLHKRTKNLNWYLLFYFFIVNFLWHNIRHANSEAKNNKKDEFFRLKHKCKLHFEKKKKQIQQCWVYYVGFIYRDDLLVKRDCIEKSWLNICKF